MDKRAHADRDAEAGFERLLRETLRGDVGAAGSECVEADALAAWTEGALAPSERSFVEAHVARCVRCQSMLAVLARTVPVEPERAAWSFRQWLTMLAPAAAAATAIAVWFAVEPRRSQREEPAQQLAAVREAPPPASIDAPAREETRALGDRRNAPAAASATQEAMSSKKPADATPRERPAAPLAGARKDEGLRKELDRLSADAKTREVAAEFRAANAKTVAEQPVAVPSPTVAQAAPPAAPPPAAAPQSATISTTVTAQSPVVQTAQAAVQQRAAAPRDQQQADSQRASGFAGGGAGRGGGALERAALNESIVVAPLVVAPANSVVQWRVVNERIVQHSDDKGANYATQYALDEKSAVTAGSSPTPLVAWLVGRGGLVIATIDGRTWRRIAFPEPADLVSVLAIDARTATVTTADRRSFMTTDGGASWTAVKAPVKN